MAAVSPGTTTSQSKRPSTNRKPCSSSLYQMGSWQETEFTPSIQKKGLYEGNTYRAGAWSREQMGCSSNRPPQDQRDKEERKVFPEPSEGQMVAVEATIMERCSHSRKCEPEQRAAGKKCPHFSPPILRAPTGAPIGPTPEARARRPSTQ